MGGIGEDFDDMWRVWATKARSLKTARFFLLRETNRQLRSTGTARE